jgi:predicted kinase
MAEEIRKLAKVVADFHERCDRDDGITQDAAIEKVLGRWRDSLETVRRFQGSVVPEGTVDRIGRFVEHYLRGREPLFELRRRVGALVDGHGDLLADDIFCLPDGPRVLDCLEFDDRLRHLDRLDDVACLAMDLEHLRAPELAQQLIDDYLEFSGDHAPPSLVEHFLAYRAFVRAKVACLRRAQGEAAAEVDARELADLTERHLQAGEVTLVLVGGAPGTGKSTVAAGVADRLGMCVIVSDRVRKELAGLAAETSGAAAYGEGIYDPAWTERVYAEVLRRAGVLLALGESVVLDATWADAARRREARELAIARSAALVELRCDAPLPEASARLRARGPTVSDADVRIASRLRLDFASWPEAVSIATAEPVEASVAQAVTRIQPRTLDRRMGVRATMVPD